MRTLLALCDYFVLVSGTSGRQLKAIVDAVEESLRAEGVKPLRREGEREMRWLLLDYGDVVVHVFDTETRSYYELERLWTDAPVLDWQAAIEPTARARGGSRH